MKKGEREEKSERINCFIKCTCRQKKIKITKFTSSLKNLSPYRRMQITTESFLFNIV